jgi:hypothetical protein
VTASTGAGLTLGLADDTGTADVVNVTMKASAVVNANTITAANVETVNISGIDAAAANVSAINVLTLTANKATDVVVTGNDGLALTATGSTKVTNFDASAVAATNSSDTAANMAVSYTSLNTSATANVTIKGGAGNDTLQGNAGNDTISGNGGTDTITYTGGNDTLSGGAGVDTFQFTGTLLAANSTASNLTTVDGGAGTDIISVTTDTTALVDADFDGFTSTETLTFSDGTNSVVLGAKGDAAGISSVNGGTAADTIDLRDVDFDNAISIRGGDGTDVIQMGTTQAATYVVDYIATFDDDVITGWTSGTDQISIDKSVTSVSGAVGDNLINGNYYEGAVASMVAGTAYDVVVLTGASYANVNAAEDAIAGVSTSTTAAVVIFHDSGVGAHMFYDASIGADNALADTNVAAFTNITSLALTASNFAVGDFNIIA